MAARPSNLTIPTLLTIIVFIMSNASSAAKNPCEDSGPVVPTAPLVSFLEKVQETALRTSGPKGFDPKLYVDMPLKSNLSTTHDAFDSLTRNGPVPDEALKGFLKQYLDDAEADLVAVVPPDFKGVPEHFLPRVDNREVRVWGLEVHKLWKNLSRKVSSKVLEQPDFHTLLPLNHSVVIPGSRFREVYYWDTYFVNKGLLASKMVEMAKGIVSNLISLVHEFGYVLNGARKYYTNRSQPPLLSSMVVDIYNETHDLEFVKFALPALLKEYEFWTSGVHNVIVRDSKGSNQSLSRYYASWNQPRPESYTIDKETASKVPSKCKPKLYREIATTAETGWDFSSRWMRVKNDLTTLSTTSILPVDLNAFILKMELDITYLSDEIGDPAKAKRFQEASRARKNAINSILWNKKRKQWFDYWLSDSDLCEGVYTFNPSSQNIETFASNFIPLWIHAFNSDVKLVDEVVHSLLKSGLIRPAGIATSLNNSGQQWDYPNGWAPIQYMIVHGLMKSESKHAKEVAEDIVVKWIRTNYATYNKTGAMLEKYDVETCGGSGGGGEYVTQLLTVPSYFAFWSCKKNALS
ncbi:trehalase [Striga asiatica]|uniref:Trehalase n=1 Tax=Striga asiatica TaxID=4170 RepID=A0A5A7PPR1_STRAF|nr:trehalase [Striga asiatica]